MGIKKSQYVALAEFRCGLRKFLMRSEILAKEEGLTPQQHQLLLVIQGQRNRDWASIRTISEALLLEHHSVVQLVDRSIEKGIVTKKRSPNDRRVAQIEVTELGLEKLERLATSHIKELKLLSGNIDLNALLTLSENLDG